MRRGISSFLSLFSLLFLSGCELEEPELCRELVVNTAASLELHLNSRSYSSYSLEKILSLTETEKFLPSGLYLVHLRTALGRALQGAIYEQKMSEFESNPKVRTYLSQFDETPELSQRFSFNAVKLCAAIETIAKEHEKGLPGIYEQVGDQFMQTLDSNSHYLGGERFSSVFGEDEKSIGFETWFTEGKPALISLVYEGLRASQWIEEGDLIHSVNGKKVNALSRLEWGKLWKSIHQSKALVEFLVEKHNGVKGRLTVRPESLPRNHITARVLTTEEGRNLIYLRSYSFDEKTAEGVKEKLSQIGLSDKAGMIIDLRGNGGGLVSAAQELAGYFIGNQRAMSYDRRSRLYQEITSSSSIYSLADELRALTERIRRSRENKTSVKLWNGEVYHVESHFDDPRYTSERGYGEPFGLERTASTTDPVAIGMPILILMDRGAASASELFAGALVDWGVALVAGELSYGKGVAQIVLPLGKILKRQDWKSVSLVTVGEFLRPSGKGVQEVGISPDLEMDFRFAQGYLARRMRDSENPIHSEGDRNSGLMGRFIMRDGLLKALEEAKLRDARLTAGWTLTRGRDVLPRTLDLFDSLLDANVYDHSSILTFDPKEGATLRPM